MQAKLIEAATVFNYLVHDWECLTHYSMTTTADDKFRHQWQPDAPLIFFLISKIQELHDSHGTNLKKGQLNYIRDGHFLFSTELLL
jgi:hypothetical protein